VAFVLPNFWGQKIAIWEKKWRGATVTILGPVPPNQGGHSTKIGDITFLGEGRSKLREDSVMLTFRGENGGTAEMHSRLKNESNVSPRGEGPARR